MMELVKHQVQMNGLVQAQDTNGVQDALLNLALTAAYKVLI